MKFNIAHNIIEKKKENFVIMDSMTSLLKSLSDSMGLLIAEMILISLNITQIYQRQELQKHI